MLNLTSAQLYDRFDRNCMIKKDQKKTDFTKSRNNNDFDSFIQNNSQPSSVVAFTGALSKFKPNSSKDEITEIEKMNVEMPTGKTVEEIAKKITETEDIDKKTKQTIKFINKNKKYLFEKLRPIPYFGSYYIGKNELNKYGHNIKNSSIDIDYQGIDDIYKNCKILKNLFNSFESPERNELFKLLLQKNNTDYHLAVLQNLDLKDKTEQETFFWIMDNSDDICGERENQFLNLGFDRLEDFPNDQYWDAYTELKKRVWKGY